MRQHVIATLGRLDELAARGSLAALLASGARYCDQILALSVLADEDSAARLSACRLGGPLLFGRLWQTSASKASSPSISRGALRRDSQWHKKHSAGLRLFHSSKAFPKRSSTLTSSCGARVIRLTAKP